MAITLNVLAAPPAPVSKSVGESKPVEIIDSHFEKNKEGYVYR